MIDFGAVRAIRTEDEYEAALVAIRPFFDDEPDPGTDAGAQLEALALLIEDYETKHYPTPAVRPLEALKFRMEHSGRTQSDLAVLLGSRSRASEIMTGKRDLSLDQIRKLHREWKIPIASLIGDMAHA